MAEHLPRFQRADRFPNEIGPNMKPCIRHLLSVCLMVQLEGFCGESTSLRAHWDMPPQCDPFAAVRIPDLREELRQTGYRLVIAIHPAPAAQKENPSRDLFVINADGTGLR